MTPIGFPANLFQKHYQMLLVKEETNIQMNQSQREWMCMVLYTKYNIYMQIPFFGQMLRNFNLMISN